MTQTPPQMPPPADVAPPAPSVARHLRSIFFTGLLTLIPLFVTLWVLKFIYDTATSFSRPIANSLVPALIHLYAPRPLDADAMAYDRSVTQIQNVASPILAILISAMVVYILGLLGTFVVGKRMLAAAERFLENLPLIKGIYGTTKQVITVFRKGGGGQGFQRVVLVEFPRSGIWTVGFVTNTITNAATHAAYVCVFIPMTPNPTSGFFQLFPLEQVRDTDWSIDQGIKIILSGGLLAPSVLNFEQPTAAASQASRPAS